MAWLHAGCRKASLMARSWGWSSRLGYLLTVVVGYWVLAKRVRNKEAILKRTFGTEWDIYIYIYIYTYIS